jgi:hypothetical protein
MYIYGHLDEYLLFQFHIFFTNVIYLRVEFYIFLMNDISLQLNERGLADISGISPKT